MIPSLSRPPLINSLHSKLVNGSLPGETAHLEMAHAIRKAYSPSDIHTTKEAGVLITLFESAPGSFSIILIRRGSGHEADKHAGQIGFPGGKKEDGDKDMIYTALREAEEEIALDLAAIDILGPLSPIYIPVSKFRVHPYVSFALQPPLLSRQESEIEEILLLPLSEFRSGNARQTTRINISPGITLNHVPCFLVMGHVIWGATAMILNELFELMK